MRYIDPNGNEIISHDDLKGLDRLKAEAKDCYGASIKAGLGASFNFSALKIIDCSVGVDLGSREVTDDKNGLTTKDTISAQASVSILDFGSLGIDISKESSVTEDASDFGDIVKNAWTGDGEVEISPLASFNVGKGELSADDSDIIVGVGGQFGLGFNIWANFSEIGDFLKYCKDLIFKKENNDE